MPDDFEINITPNAISVRTRKIRRVKDQDTGEVLELPDSDHRRAIGLGDHPTPDAFRAAVADLIRPVLGKDAGDAVGRAAAAYAERDVARTEQAAAEADRDTVVGERDALAAELTALKNGTAKADTEEIIRETKP